LPTPVAGAGGVNASAGTQDPRAAPGPSSTQPLWTSNMAATPTPGMAPSPTQTTAVGTTGGQGEPSAPTAVLVGGPAFPSVAAFATAPNVSKGSTVWGGLAASSPPVPLPPPAPTTPLVPPSVPLTPSPNSAGGGAGPLYALPPAIWFVLVLVFAGQVAAAVRRPTWRFELGTARPG